MMQASNDAFWCVSAKTLLYQMASREAGLTQAEADERLLRFGPNIVIEHRRVRLLAKVAKRFVEPLVAILLVAPTPTSDATELSHPFLSRTSCLAILSSSELETLSRRMALFNPMSGTGNIHQSEYHLWRVNWSLRAAEQLYTQNPAL